MQSTRQRRLRNARGGRSRATSPSERAVRSRPDGVSKLMANSTAVTAGYLCEPDTELPSHGHEFARRVSSLLAAADRPSIWDSRPRPGPYTGQDARAVDLEHRQTIPEQTGSAKR